jgi:hypothetical protein
MRLAEPTEMYLHIYFDFELPFLKELLELLDRKPAAIYARIDESPDPDGYGLYDDAEYITGLGFVACQRFINATYSPSQIAKSAALANPPIHTNGKSVARVINAAANMWKHSNEWNDATPRGMSKSTIETIESVTPYKDYPAFSLLYALTGTNTLMALVPFMEEWRKHLAGDDAVPSMRSTASLPAPNM